MQRLHQIDLHNTVDEKQQQEGAHHDEARQTFNYTRYATAPHSWLSLENLSHALKHVLKEDVVQGLQFTLNKTAVLIFPHGGVAQ